eukprot:scaffold60479_cov63-Phaeocystis_antarctica.AAC.3
MRPSKVGVRVSPQTPGHQDAVVSKDSFITKQNDFAHVIDSDEFIGEDASGPAGQLIVTIEEGCRSVVKMSTAAAVRAPTAPEACLPACSGLSSGPESEALAARMPRRGCGGLSRSPAQRLTRSPAHPLAHSPAHPPASAIQARHDRGRQQRAVRPVLHHQGGPPSPTTTPTLPCPTTQPRLPRRIRAAPACQDPDASSLHLSTRPVVPTYVTCATRWLGASSGARACAPRPSTRHGTRRTASKATCATWGRSLSACECTTATASR